MKRREVVERKEVLGEYMTLWFVMVAELGRVGREEVE